MIGARALRGAHGSAAEAPAKPARVLLVAVIVPAARTTQPDHGMVAALWLATAGTADRERLINTLARVDEHVERSKNPLVEDLGEVTLREDAAAARAQMGPGWTVVSALAKLSAADGACSGELCVRIAEECPPAVECMPLEAALRDKRARLAMWPLAGGAALRCSDPARLEDAAARLRTRGAEKTSTIGWAIAGARPVNNDVRGSAASLLASLQGIPDSTPPPWLLALSQAGKAPSVAWLQRLGAALVAPKLSRWVERSTFLAEARAEVEPLGCSVEPIVESE